MTDHIRYDLLVQDALKAAIRRVLSDVVRDGLPGDHHFYISFRTDKPGVKISAALRERYPRDMTIVLQHQFTNLTVNEAAFEVGLSFSGVPERLRVPFDSLLGFFDPSVQFGLKFEAAEDAAAAAPDAAAPAAIAGPVPKVGPRKLEPVGQDGEAEPARTTPGKATAGKATAGKAGLAKAGFKREAEPEADAAEPSAEVVSLDAFRKKS